MGRKAVVARGLSYIDDGTYLGALTCRCVGHRILMQDIRGILLSNLF